MSRFIGGYKTNRGYKRKFMELDIGSCFGIPWWPFIYVKTIKWGGFNAEEYGEKHKTYIPPEAEVTFYSKVIEN